MKKRILIALFGLVVLPLNGCSKAEEETATSEIQQVENVTVAEQKAKDETDVTEPEQDEPEEIKIVMAGDMLLHDRIEASCKNDDGSYSYDEIFENVEDEIASADIAIANQEVMIGGEELGVSGYPSFNAPYEFADALVSAGFDVVCQGTNHAMDKGSKGILNCLNYWNEKFPEIGVLGIHDSEADSEEIYYWQSDEGTKIAILNYTFGTNGISTPDGMGYLVDYLDEEKVVEDLNEAEENADFTIVCPHWGTEYSLTSDASQDKWAQIFVDNGADLIIGTHPHVIEPIGTVTSEDGTNSAIVYYSIGNFVNWTSGEGEGVSNRMVGGLATVTLQVEEGQVSVKENDVIPIVSHVTHEAHGVTVYKLSDYTQELASENAINEQVDDFSLDYCQNLVGQVWSK